MIVDKKTLADLLGCSERWISSLAEKGMPAQSSAGRGSPMRIDAANAIKWYINYEISKRISGDDDGKIVDEDSALKRARRLEIMLKIAERKKHLVPVVGVEQILIRIADIYSSMLDGLSSRVAPELALLDDPAEIRSYVHNETRQIRASTAERIVEELRVLAESSAQLLNSERDSDDSNADDEESESVGE